MDPTPRADQGRGCCSVRHPWVSSLGARGAQERAGCRLAALWQQCVERQAGRGERVAWRRWSLLRQPSSPPVAGVPKRPGDAADGNPATATSSSMNRASLSTTKRAIPAWVHGPTRPRTPPIARQTLVHLARAGLGTTQRETKTGRRTVGRVRITVDGRSKVTERSRRPVASPISGALRSKRPCRRPALALERGASGWSHASSTPN
jgi:hypothetical protein